MDKFFSGAGAAALVLGALVLGAPAAATVLGSDAEACREGATAPAALVRVHGFKDRTGGLRVQLYSDVPDDFLASGKKLRRVEVEMTPAASVADEPMDVCMALPASGRFAVAVLHDRDGDKKLSIWRDGVGFSNNPKIGLGKPDLDKVLFEARPGTAVIDVVMNYRSGLAVRPLAGR